MLIVESRVPFVLAAAILSLSAAHDKASETLVDRSAFVIVDVVTSFSFLKSNVHEKVSVVA